MDHSPVFQIYVYNQALAWLKENPERLTNQEKQQFLLDLKNFLNKNLPLWRFKTRDRLVKRCLLVIL